MSWIRRETEKETVQYICPHCHDYHQFREDFGERTFRENYIFCRRCGARNGTGNAPTLTPPNKLLSEEQLLEMNNVPIWVVDTSINRGEWCYWKDGFAYSCESPPEYYDLDDYGHWLAYSRPPEGEE